ncbi:MAG: 7-cyano-7-deazaguanine synthase QueC [Pseudomonadota bacterium]
MPEKKAIVLSSGGIDSTTVMAIAKAEGYALYSLTCNYGQRHASELEAAGRVANYFAVKKHLVIDMDLRAIGGSALTDNIDVPKNRLNDAILSYIPVTYVPARNTIFLSYALAWAEVLDAPDIYIGVNAVDYSGYPDCRPEFIAAFERLANLAIKAAVEGQLIVKIRAPLIAMTKAEIIRMGVRLGVDYSLTHSCYDPPQAGTACGLCDSCHLRREGFREAGVPDPTHYAI